MVCYVFGVQFDFPDRKLEGVWNENQCGIECIID